MIGQSVINVKSGGRRRLSTLVAGVFLMFLILVLGDLVVQIPMSVLVGIMIMVCIGTFDRSSFSYLIKAPKSDAIVMLATVIIVIGTSDLSKGVLAGVILSALFFVSKISKIHVIERKENEKVIFEIEGQLFFASVEGFVEAFDFTIKNTNIIIDFKNTHVWDDSAVGAIDKVIIKYSENNNKVTINGLNSASKILVDKLAVYDNPNAKLSAH